jgi:hypothetical protein
MVEAALPCRDECGKWTAHPVDHLWSSSPDVSRFLLRICILRTASPEEVLQVLSSWNVVIRGTSASAGSPEARPEQRNVVGKQDNHPQHMSAMNFAL